MDGLASERNGQESDYGSSPWIELGPFDSLGGPPSIPPPYLAAQSPFSGTSLLPPITPTSSRLQPVPIPRLHTIPAPSAPTPRRTLTDEDRRRMCLYHEENKSAKQTDIGVLFGVERSTVSKVLRQKEKYLNMDNGSRSPIKRHTGDVPDIEKTLANWVRNRQRQGVVLTQAVIKEKAHWFAATCASPDEKQKILTADWLEEFMRNKNLTACSSRKNSADTVASDGERTLPIPPIGLTPSCLSPSLGQETKNELGDTAFNFSGDSTKNDQSSPSLSAGVTSPTSPLVSESPYAPTVHSRHPSISSAAGGLLSQTLNKNDEIYSSTDSKHSTNGPSSGTVLDSPLDGKLEEGNLIDTWDLSSRCSARHHESNADLKSIGNSMQPPKLPLGTQDEARHALDLVINYIQSQPGLELPIQDYITLGKLRAKLDVARNNQSISGSRIDEDTDRLRMTKKRTA